MAYVTNEHTVTKYLRKTTKSKKLDFLWTVLYLIFFNSLVHLGNFIGSAGQTIT